METKINQIWQDGEGCLMTPATSDGSLWFVFGRSDPISLDNPGVVLPLSLVADETGHTTRPGIFASGDVVNGARTVVEAVAHSKVVAESMHEYMQSLLKETQEE